MAPVCDVYTRGRSTTKKALLVGISYYNETDGSDQKLDPIPTSIPNIKKFKAFLEDSWEYTDITVMTDEDGVEERLQPTTANLEREMKALGHGVKSGDRRVFYFAGHSDQMPCKTGSEEDGMDEALVALNGFKIRDNKLRDLLVKDLPKDSALTAIFDSCNSGTLLDLPHYKCNNVYRPWVNKGKRGSDTLHNPVVRKNCRCTRPTTPSQPRSSKGSGDHFLSFTQVVQTMGRHPDVAPSSGRDTDKHDGERCASPERQFECEGWCRDSMQRKGSLQYADVTSISSSNDGQISWDASTRNGDSVSMTSFLIDILKKHPELTYYELMTRLNHAVHSFTMKMHNSVQQERRARRKAHGKNPNPKDAEPEEDKGEMDNFQDLQLGSIMPVDMDRIFML